MRCYILLGGVFKHNYLTYSITCSNQLPLFYKPVLVYLCRPYSHETFSVSLLILDSIKCFRRCVPINIYMVLICIYYFSTLQRFC